MARHPRCEAEDSAAPTAPWSPAARWWKRAIRSLPLAGLIALVVLAADFITGPFIQFPFLFIAPVAMAAWFHGRRWGLAFALVLPTAHTAINLSHRVPWSFVDVGINACIRVAVLVLFAHLMDLAAQRRRLADEVQVLRGLLPICSFCKRIRNADGTWEVIEKYIADRTEAEFTHGICAPCARKHYHVELKDE